MIMILQIVPATKKVMEMAVRTDITANRKKNIDIPNTRNRTQKSTLGMY